jgi:hypothetical protein
MPIYHVVITGHLDKWRLPPDNSLPDKIYQIYNYDVKSIRQLNNYIDARIGDILACNGMKAFREPNQRDLTKLEDSITVPVNMIAYISHKVTEMTGELPLYKDGETILKSGEEVVKQ